MRLSELIDTLEALKSGHGDIAVMVDGYEGGFDYPSGTAVLQVVKYPIEYGWRGDYDEARWVDDEEANGESFPAVVINR